MPTSTAAAELGFLGSRVRILESGDALGLVDMIEVPARDRSPLHVHHTHDEGFYVLAGQVTLHTPGRAVTLRPGEFLNAPKGVPHCYEVGDAPARWLVTSTPAGFERFVAAVAALDVVEPERLAAVAAEHDIEILGPPGARP